MQPMTLTSLDLAAIRARFPALALRHAGRPMAFFDGPGGTQVPESVIDAVSRYYRESNANSGGAFSTSERSDAIAHEAHVAVAEMLGTPDPEEIKLGANMTTLTFHVSRSLIATMVDGDEIIVTGLDHEANVSPWRLAAADRGIRVLTWEPHLEDCTLDLADLDKLLSPRTRLVAVGWASNAVGTINPIEEIVSRAHAAGAWTYVDAVHYAPHAPIDVRAIDTDFLACSAYKFFGPHVGALYGRRDVLDRLPAYKVRPSHDRFETGTANFEGLAGVIAAVDYLASLAPGDTAGEPGTGEDRRGRIVGAMTAVREYETALYRRLADGLADIPGLRLHGITDPARFEARTPTAALTIDGIHPRALAEGLGREGIAAWDGDFYATGLIERLGLADSGGVLRVGLVHYNTADEVDRLVAALAGAAAARS
jgi:cysteine desulfurase family protein (TIGR01976 family)